MTQPEPTKPNLIAQQFTNPDGTTYDPTEKDWGTTYDAIERGVQDGIDTSGGIEAFASVKRGAWHNLGTVHEEQVTAEQLLVSAYADYPVLKAPVHATVTIPAGTMDMTGFYADETVKRIEVPNTMATYRPHPTTGELQVLGIVSPKYQVFTNRESFLGFGDALIDLAHPTASTCGVLYQGRQAFMCWKLDEETTVGGLDAVEWWLLVTTSHDGSSPLTAAITPLRTVCANTVRYNLVNAASKWTIRHTRNAKLAVHEAQQSLKLSHTYQDRWASIADSLLNVQMTTARFDQIIAKTWGPGEEPSKKAEATWDEKRGVLLDLFANAPTQELGRGTAWAGLQAVTEYADYAVGVQDRAVKAQGWDSPDAYRFWRSVSEDKTIQKPKQDALSAIAEYAGVALT